MGLRRSKRPDIDKLTRKGDVGKLASALAHESSSVRQEAVQALGGTDARAIPALLSVLGDVLEPISVRALAGKGLLRLGAAAQALGLLLEAWASSGDGPDRVGLSEMARDAAKEAGGDAGPVLIDALASGNERLCQRAAELLGHLRHRPAVPALSAALKHPVERVRIAIIEALERIGDRSASEALTSRLGDESDYVRYTALLALGLVGTSDAVPAVLAEVADPYVDLRNRAIVSLGEMAQRRVPGALEALTGVVRRAPEPRPTPSTRLADPRVPTLRVVGGPEAVAAGRLGMVGDPEALEPLIDSLHSEDDTLRLAAAKALGELGDQRAIQPLIQRLDDSSVWVAMAAAWALGRLRAADALDALVVLLRESSDPEMRRTAAVALGEIGDPRAVEALTAALDDPYVVEEYHEAQDLYLPTSFPVRDAADGALERIRSGSAQAGSE